MELAYEVPRGVEAIGWCARCDRLVERRCAGCGRTLCPCHAECVAAAALGREPADWPDEPFLGAQHW
jgi:hypothetical protein